MCRSLIYSCTDHWIVFYIYPFEGKVLVEDSLHVPPDKYQPFLVELER